MGSRETVGQERIALGESILVLVDLQERLLPVIAEKEGVVENVRRLARFAEIIGLPLLVAKQIKLGKVIPEIRALTQAATAVEKHHFDCLASPAFRERLGEIHRGVLILCGIETHICVTQTALHALEDGYRVHVVADATSSRSRGNWEIGLARLRDAGAIITSTEMVIYELLGKAGTEAFRRVLPIVK